MVRSPSGRLTRRSGSPRLGRPTSWGCGRALVVWARSSPMSVLTDVLNRGVKDAFLVVCDGFKGLPEVVANVWPLTTVQTGTIGLDPRDFRLASRRDWDALRGDGAPIHNAVIHTAARAALDELTTTWTSKNPAMIRLWENAWEGFIPFLDYGACREMGCSTAARRRSVVGGSS